MDTRSKIVDAQAVPGGCTVVTGYFDVLRAEHARELGDLPRPLVAVVLPFAAELLGQRARAEMVAALRVIDYVVVAEDADVETWIERLKPSRVVRMEAADERRARQLREHVRNRQSG